MNAATQIIASQTWLSLATIDADGFPHASYIPYAKVPGGIGIVVSRRAPHAVNLQRQPRACALIVGCRPSRETPCAGARLSIDVIARPAAPQMLNDHIWAALEMRHGETIRTFREIPDFAALILEPVRSRLVLGLASTQYVDETRPQHRTARFHAN